MTTPIEQYKDILLKRDDLFVIGNVCGGKARQCKFLLEKHLNEIREKHGGVVICPVSIKSPQSAIVGEIGRQLNLTTKIIAFQTNKPNINLSIAQDCGAILIPSPSGYTSVIESIANKECGFNIKMGFSSPEVLEANIDEVENLPDDLDYLVVPVGSAMNFISIIIGLKKFNKHPKHIVGVYVGKDPRPTLNKYLTEHNYTLIKSPYSYGSEVNIDNYFFDPIYEAKAYKWLIENLDVKNNKVLLWVVGKRNLNYPTKEIKWK